MAVLEELVRRAERKVLAGMGPAEERRYLRKLGGWEIPRTAVSSGVEGSIFPSLSSTKRSSASSTPQTYLLACDATRSFTCSMSWSGTQLLIMCSVRSVFAAT